MIVNLNCKEEDVTIWRYLTFEKFLDLVTLKEPRLFLCRLDKLQDAYEKSLSINQIIWLDSIGCSDESKKIQKNLRETIFINSWNISEYELYSLWKSYVSDHIYGVAIKSTPRKLKESINAIKSNCSREDIIYIDKVNYDSKSTEVNIHSIALKKEPFYTTEDELRIYTESKNENIFIPVDLNLLIDEIVISPFISKYAKFNFKNLIYYYLKENKIETKTISFSQIIFD